MPKRKNSQEKKTSAERERELTDQISSQIDRDNFRAGYHGISHEDDLLHQLNNEVPAEFFGDFIKASIRARRSCRASEFTASGLFNGVIRFFSPQKKNYSTTQRTFPVFPPPKIRGKGSTF